MFKDFSLHIAGQGFYCLVESMADQTDCSAAFTDCLCDRDFWIDKDESC